MTLLALAGPHLQHRACIQARADAIVQQAEGSASRYGVPVGLLLVVGFLESHWGCAAHSGGCWGAPAHASTPHVAGTSDNAASALALGWDRCGERGGWTAAVRHFRCGRCDDCPGQRGYTAETAVRLTARAYVAADLPTTVR